MQLSVLDPDLERLGREFDLIEANAHQLLEGLTAAQLVWTPAPSTWSVRTCLDHLVVSGRYSLGYVARAIADARSRGTYGRGPFRYGVFERWFVWFMDGPSRVKLRVPRPYRPRQDRPPDVVVQDFFELQHDLRRSLVDASGLDLARVKVSNPVTSWIRFSLGQEFALTAAHERRHLHQARRLVRHSAFPV